MESYTIQQRIITVKTFYQSKCSIAESQISVMIMSHDYVSAAAKITNIVNSIEKKTYGSGLTKM